MDFISSRCFPNEPLISFLKIFVVTFGWLQHQRNSKPTQMFKKYSTDQRFIQKRNTTYDFSDFAQVLMFRKSI